jgi:hypothetical protein
MVFFLTQYHKTISKNIKRHHQVQSSMKLAVFIHAAILPRCEEILQRFLQRIKESGLYDAALNVYISFVGTDPFPENLVKRTTTEFPKITLLRSSNELKDYEVPTQQLLHSFCLENQDYNVLYLHTKNVGKESNPCVEDWVEYMSYFSIDQWRNATSFLENYKTSGVDLREQPTLHYSGNFWWARASHIASLPSPLEFRNLRKYPNPLNSERHNQEFWITYNTSYKEHKGLWESGIDCYQRHLHLYPSHIYKTNT